jgi:hypothetical protein
LRIAHKIHAGISDHWKGRRKPKADLSKTALEKMWFGDGTGLKGLESKPVMNYQKWTEEDEARLQKKKRRCKKEIKDTLLRESKIDSLIEKLEAAKLSKPASGVTMDSKRLDVMDCN